MRTDLVTQLRMRWIRPGRYLRGSGEDDPEAYEWENPQHEVVLTEGFWLSDAPVTQALWVAVMGENPSQFEGVDRPVERVSWEEAQRFCARLSQRCPDLYPRLPTDAEWEYAARAGTSTSRYGALDDIAWYSENSDGQTHPVRQKQPNDWGLHDILGNVWEWCQDSSADDDPQLDPLGVEGSRRVCRGGSWIVGARGVRAAYHLTERQGARVDSLGFRLAAGRAPGSSARDGSAGPEGTR